MYLRLLNATVNATQNGTGSEAAKPLWHSCEQTQKLWGAGYNVFMIMLLLGFLAELIWCAVSFKEYMDNLKKDMDVKGYIYVLLLIALVSRVFWALDPHPNSAVLFVHLYRNTDAGAFINVITLKVTQIAALMAGTLMILIWRQIVEAAQKMKKVKDNSGVYNIVMGACGVLVLIQFPANMAAAFLTGTSLGSLLDNGANAIFGLYMLTMLAGALWYVVGLQRLLADMKSEQGKAMISKVQNVILLCIIVVVATISGIVIYAMFVSLCKDNGPTATLLYMIFIFLIHFGEMVGCGALLYQCSSTRKTKSGGYADKDQKSMRSTAGSTAVEMGKK